MSADMPDKVPLTLEEKLARYAGPAFSAGPGRDPEVLRRPVLEPATELELEGMKLLDPVDAALFAHKMDCLVDEGRSVYMNLGLSGGAEAGDVGVAVFTAQGDLVAMSTGVVMHAVLHYGPIKYILKHYRDDPTVGLKDGDIFFFNDPVCGGVHPYDVFVNMPIFYQGQLVAWAAAGGHQGEVGSRDPGGFSCTANSRYEEGLHITPLKIGENFQIKSDHLDFLCNSVRTPRVLAGDTRARVAVCLRLRERLLREIEKRGAPFVAGAMRQVIEQARQAARQRIRSFNDGTYRAVAFLDTIGVDDGLLRVPVTLIKRGDSLVIDVSGASPEPGIGPFHSRWHLIRAASALALLPHVFRGLRWSIGLFDPVKVIAPPSFLNASEEVACGSGSFVARVAVQALHLAMCKMIFDSDQRESVSAPFAENILNYLYGGTDQFGFPMADVPMTGNAAGMGARWDKDGEHSAGFYWAMVVDCPGAEEHEARFPWVYFARNAVQTNQVGFGKHRGGAGVADLFVIHNVPWVTSSSIGTGARFTKNYGLFGGYSGAPTVRFIIERSDLLERMARGDPGLPHGLYELANQRQVQGDYRFLSPNGASQRYDKGTVFVLVRGCGGGYGDVLERDPALVVKDVREGLVTPRLAREVYSVHFDAETMDADEEATAAHRQQERKNRLARGLKYDDFVRRWSRLKPPPEALKYYGDWPFPDGEQGTG